MLRDDNGAGRKRSAPIILSCAAPSAHGRRRLGGYQGILVSGGADLQQQSAVRPLPWLAATVYRTVNPRHAERFLTQALARVIFRFPEVTPATSALGSAVALPPVSGSEALRSERIVAGPYPLSSVTGVEPYRLDTRDPSLPHMAGPVQRVSGGRPELANLANRRPAIKRVGQIVGHIVGQRLAGFWAMVRASNISPQRGRDFARFLGCA